MSRALDLCLVCGHSPGYCNSCWSVNRLNQMSTDSLEVLYNECTDPINRWPDGREDNLARTIKSILERRAA